MGIYPYTHMYESNVELKCMTKYMAEINRVKILKVFLISNITQKIV